jgi:hypothetical protein
LVVPGESVENGSIVSGLKNLLGETEEHSRIVLPKAFDEMNKFAAGDPEKAD